ncbi:MAG: hypothetical protein WBV94_30905 [Blastocatellia bacterium]
MSFALASILLALTVLANFFNAITAGLFIAVTVVSDLSKRLRAKEQSEKGEEQRALIAHSGSPLLAILLTLFWAEPMIGAYSYFVTRPQTVPLNELIPPAIWVWYGLAIAGAVYWLRQPAQATRTYLGVCILLAASVIFAATISPAWFPLQTPRFVSTLNFLLAVPVGHLLTAAYNRLAVLTGDWSFQFRGRKPQQQAHSSLPIPIAAIITIIALAPGFLLMKKPSYKLSFHGTDDSERIDGVLRFAQQHREGRYLVEVPNFSYAAAALVVSNFSLKQRRRNEYDFIRFAEEQFADGWFDVLLARSPETKVDSIAGLDQFGALILDTYDYADETKAFEQLRTFARDHLLILLSSNDPLFRHIQAAGNEFTLLKIIERAPEEAGPRLEAAAPGFRYGPSAIRKIRGEIRHALEGHKGVSNTAKVEGSVNVANIVINPTSPLINRVPVLIQTTFYPNWRRSDGEPVYTVTPFYMLTFIREPINIVYARRRSDWVGLTGSVIGLFILCMVTGWKFRKLRV